MSFTQAFAHKHGALGGGNDIAQGEHTIEEAAQRCIKLGAKGFTFQGRQPNPHGRVLCYFKSSAAGNQDPNWQTFTPHLKHKVGALGGGNDVSSGQYTLEEAFLHCLKLPNGVGFTYQGKPNQQGKLMCYFKSSADGNQDPNWQTYLKAGGAPVLGGGGRPMTPVGVGGRGVHHGRGGGHGGHHGRGGGHGGRGRALAQAQAEKAQAQQAAAQAQQAAAIAQQQAAAAQMQMQAQQAAAAAMQVCPQCKGKGGLGTFGPVPRGDMHWKRDCPNCNGQARTVNTLKCPACKGMGGQGTFGPCGILDMHFKSACGACQGRGYSPSVPVVPGMGGPAMTPRGAAVAGAVAGAAVNHMQDQIAREQAARLEAEKKMRQMEYFQKATTLKAQQQYAAAADMYNKAIHEGHPEKAECHNERGECFEELNQLNEALAEFERAISKKRNEPRFLYNRGKVYFKKAMPERSFSEKVKALGRAQADLDAASKHLGGNHQLREKIQNRMEAIQQELTTMAAEAHARGQQLYAGSDWRSAHTAFTEALSTKRGNRAEDLYLRAMCDMQGRQFDAAIKDLNESLQLQPQQPEALFQRGCAWRENRDLQKALGDMNSAAAMGHANAAQQVVPLQQEIQAEQHFQQARKLFQQGDFPGTDQMCAQALATFPPHAGALKLQRETRNAMAADMAIKHGQGLVAQAKQNPGAPDLWQGAAAALAEAARLLEGTAGLEQKLAHVYHLMAVCDVEGPYSPPPLAEGLIDQAIAKTGPNGPEGDQDLFHEVRAKVRYAKGNLAGAQADLVSPVSAG